MYSLVVIMTTMTSSAKMTSNTALHLSVITILLLLSHDNLLVSGQSGFQFGGEPIPSLTNNQNMNNRVPYLLYGPQAKSPADRGRYYHSDQRCIEDILTYTPEEVVSVNTRHGKVTGRISYLCDAPGVPERDRPTKTYPGADGHHFPSLSPNYKPRARIRGNVTVFIGIPYARSPTKENHLRFKPPQPPDHWGALETIEFRPSCPQPIEFTGAAKMIFRIDEDCLYMNIYTPYASSQISQPYPVMMYIHGGNFEHGSGNVFPGHALAESQKVVVVTFNYRLGLLGMYLLWT